MTTPENLPRFKKNQIQQIKNYFDINGFVIINSFFNIRDLIDFKSDVKSTINAYLQKANLDTIESSDDSLLTEGLLKLEKINHDFVAAVYDTLYQLPSFFRLIGDKDVQKIIQFLLTLDVSTPLYGYTQRCRIDPPSDNRRTYGWHQEIFYTVPYGSFIQTWAPLIFNTTALNGTIEVLPGSLNEKIAKQTWTEPEGRSTQIIIDEDIVNKYQKTIVEMEVGELLLFSGYLMHRSGNNSSNQVRYSLVGMYHDITHKPFIAPKISYTYRNSDPKIFFNDFFGAK